MLSLAICTNYNSQLVNATYHASLVIHIKVSLVYSILYSY